MKNSRNVNLKDVLQSVFDIPKNEQKSKTFFGCMLSNERGSKIIQNLALQLFGCNQIHRIELLIMAFQILNK